MAAFRCKKCSHLVNISLQRGMSTRGMRHSYCGGELERATRWTKYAALTVDFASDPQERKLFTTRSGLFVLDTVKKFFVQV